MPALKEAKTLAESLVEQMRPYCEKVMIAGSIRRGKPDVKDIEIMALPKWVEVPGTVAENMFSEPEPQQANWLYEWALGPQCPIRWIKPGTHDIIDWQPKAEGRYWRGVLDLRGQPLKLDLFLPHPDGYGVQTVIRTGPKEFNTALFAYLDTRGFRCAGGGLWNKEGLVICKTEEEFFTAIGIRFIPPEYRETWRDFKKLEGK